MPATKDISTLNTSELLLRREATRLKRLQLAEKNQQLQEEYLSDLVVQRTAVWKASCGTMDTRNLTLEELPQAPGEVKMPPDLGENGLGLLADQVVAETTGVGLFELDRLSEEDYASWLAFASIEMEAELLGRSLLEFQKTATEKAQFASHMGRQSLRRYGN